MAAVDTSGIGTRIARRRQELGWTQEDLASRVHVHKSTVVNWETGRHYPKRYLGAVEAQLGIDLTEPYPARPEVYTDPVEMAIWADTSMSEQKRLWFIEQLRAERVAARTISKRVNLA